VTRDRRPSGLPGEQEPWGGPGPSPEEAWALARALSPRPRVRIADLDEAGRAFNRYSAEVSLDGPPPGRPYAVNLTDARRSFRLLGFDLDPASGPVGEDLAQLSDLLTRAGLPHLTCASGPGGGRHVWVALADRVPAALVADVARALGCRLPSLDLAPLTNPATGCLRPPGAPHRLAGRSQVLTGSLPALTAPTAGTAQVRALLALLDDRPARKPATGAAVGRDRTGAPHLFGDRRPLPVPARAALHDPLPAGVDTSAVLWKALLGAAGARWRLTDLQPLLSTAPGLEHARTARSGRLRADRPPGEARRLLRRQWDRAVATAAARTDAPTEAATGGDPTFDSRAGDVVTAVAAVQSRADAAPGRWARPGGPADRRVLDAACEQLLAAVRLEVELDVRRLGLLCGVSRETARRALHRLSADGWLRPAGAACRVRAACWGIDQKRPNEFSTEGVDSGVSQASPRPEGAVGPARSAWRNALARRRTAQAHDVFTPSPGLGHHAGRVYGALSTFPLTRPELADLLGYSPTRLDRYLDRLADAGLARLGPGSAWRRSRTDRGRVARNLGVSGVLAGRRRRYLIEREAWAWWCDELDWMRLPRAQKRRRRDPAPGQAVLELSGLNTRQRYGPHPRRCDGRADYSAARLAIGRHRERRVRNAA
jgi:hypothetical protein